MDACSHQGFALSICFEAKEEGGTIERDEMDEVLNVLILGGLDSLSGDRKYCVCNYSVIRLCITKGEFNIAIG